MDLYSTSLELSRIVFLIGAILAVIYKRRYGITPGGIIVPAYLALIIDHSFEWFIGTLLVSLLTFFIFRATLQSRALPKRWVVLANISISAALILLIKYVFFKNTDIADLFLFGFAVPGLMSSNAVHYGVTKVLYGTLIVTALTVSAGYLISLIIPYWMATSLTTQLSQFGFLRINHPQILLPLSLGLAAIMTYKFDARTGGYVLPAFLAVIITHSPLQSLIFILSTVFSYFIMQVILKHSMIMGLERFLVCLLIGSLFITIGDMIAIKTGMHYLGSSLVLVVAMGVLVNDISVQQNKRKALAGIALPIVVLSVISGVL